MKGDRTETPTKLRKGDRMNNDINNDLEDNGATYTLEEAAAARLAEYKAKDDKRVREGVAALWAEFRAGQKATASKAK